MKGGLLACLLLAVPAMAGAQRVFDTHVHIWNGEASLQAGELGMIVLFDNANIVPGDSQDLFNLAVNTKGTKFVFAHLGGMNFSFWNTILFARTAKDFYKDNIYFDISATVTLVANSPIKSELIWTIRNVGLDHVMLGSEYPQFTLRQTVEALESLDFDRSEKDRILYGTAHQLLTPKTPD